MENHPSPFRVLVVDDDPHTGELLKSLLTFSGYEVESVVSAEQAIDVLPKFSPQVACVDIVLPGMSGLDLARRLRAQDTVSPLLLIAISGLERDLAVTKDAGFNFHLTKPLAFQCVVKYIEEFVSWNYP